MTNLFAYSSRSDISEPLNPRLITSSGCISVTSVLQKRMLELPTNTITPGFGGFTLSWLSNSRRDDSHPCANTLGKNIRAPAMNNNVAQNAAVTKYRCDFIFRVPLPRLAYTRSPFTMYKIVWPPPFAANAVGGTRIRLELTQRPQL